MVSAVSNPALEAFVAQIVPELIFGEVLLQAWPEGFELRHAADRSAPELRLVPITELRALADFTEACQFRPLKSAPTLRRGWRCVAHTPAELEDALQRLYPGGVADWFAALQPNPPAVDYREFTGRQTGMYRVTTLLTDEQVAQVARAGCHPRFCLKRRLWQVPGLPSEAVAEKSVLACLEPCSVLLEFARTAARLEQREKKNLSLAVEELASLAAALQHALEVPRPDRREADFSVADNPRRMRLLLEKIQPVLKTESDHEKK
jgi:hypothetical protein